MNRSLIRPVAFAMISLLASLSAPSPVRAAAADSNSIVDFGSSRPATSHVISTIPDTEPPLIRERDLSGPRIGFTVAPGDGEMYRTMREHGVGRVVSQFGWHFEHTVTPLGGGPTLVTEAIPLFGGVEYGMLIPSITFALGLRLPTGWEFGAGPSFTLSNSAGKTSSGIVLAVGKSIPYSGVNLPVNLAVSANKDGARVTLLAGYAVQRAMR